MLRFALLHHTGWPGRADHYDLLLQRAEGQSDDDMVLAAYSTLDDALPRGDGELLAINRDHRRAYLELEGALSGQRGRVLRIDGGPLEWQSAARVRLGGLKLSGIYELVPVSTERVMLRKLEPLFAITR